MEMFYATGKTLKLYQIIQMYFLWKKGIIQISVEGTNKLDFTEENNELEGTAP